MPVRGGRFVFPKTVEQTTVSDLVQLANLMPIPESYLRERYGIPAPDGDEPTAGKKADESEDVEPEEMEPEEDEKPKQMQDTPPAEQKKKRSRLLGRLGG